MRTQVLKPSMSSPLRSALDTIASDGPITAVMSSTAEAGASHLPELFRSVMPSHPPAIVAKAEAVVESAIKKEQELQKYVPSPEQLKEDLHHAVGRYTPAAATRLTARFGKWWHTERIYRVAEASLPNRKMDGLAIDGASCLQCLQSQSDLVS